jgi:hypothetical protein
MILPVRPHFFFDKLPADSQAFQIPVPIRSSDCPTALESLLLCAIAEIVQAGADRPIFEIGTYKGATARMLATNFDFVITLDLDPRISDGLLKDVDTVTRLQGHSMTFDFSRFRGLCSMVFVDGAHDEETVYSDSENAFKLLGTMNGRPRAIVWHDYNPDKWPGVVAAVRRFEKDTGLTVYRIEDTHLAVYLEEK